MNLKTIALVSIATAAVAAAPVFAACPDPAPQFGTTVASLCPANTDLGEICAVRTASPNATALFWGFNKGNFAANNLTPNCAEATCGSDNGSWAYNDVEAGGDGSIAWLLDAGLPNTFVITGDWAGAGQRTNMIDGCPATEAGKTGPIMMVGISDEAPNGLGYFAIASARKGASPSGADYDFSLINGSTPGDIVLRQVPRPSVNASANLGGGSRSFTIRSLTLADIANGIYGDGSLTPAEAVQGFKIYTRIVPRGAAVPSNTRSAWTPAGGVVAMGAPDTTVVVNCATNADVYMGYSIVGNSGWEPTFVGTSRVGQCGPTLADPGKGKGKAIGRQ